MLNADIISAIEDIAPAWFQQSWDNTGVQVGSLRDECTGVLVSLDITPEIVDEARDRSCNLIISHHPLLFRGLKRLSGNTPVEEAVMRAVAYGISIYSCHTAVDSVPGGVSRRMASMLGATPHRALSPLTDLFVRFSAIVCPEARYDALTAFGQIAPEASCFVSEADRSAYETTASDPYATTDMSFSKCTKIEAKIFAHKSAKLGNYLSETLGDRLISFSAGLTSDIDPNIGLGVYATFDNEGLSPLGLVEKVKHSFGSPIVRCTSVPDSSIVIRRIALCGGSGAEFIPAAIRAGAQAFITSDTKYHDFVDFQNDIFIIDIGHFESESCTKEIFYNVIKEKFPNFACYYSEIEKNPIKYL